MTFDERRRDARFTVINQQQLTTASANDTRDYSKELRGTVEGPIPAQCRTASCGTCWVGILGGNDHLSEVDAHEKKRMKEFGYINTSRAEARHQARVPGDRLRQRDDRDSAVERLYREA